MANHKQMLIVHQPNGCSDKKAKAYRIWMECNGSITGVALSEQVGCSFSATCKWIRGWKGTH